MYNKKIFSNLLVLFLFVGLFSCSTKKNAFLNRNFHALNTKYNVLYNGNVAFDQAKKQLDDNYKDNFWELLPIEPLKIEEEKIDITLPSFQKKEEVAGESTAQGFDKAEEKAIKAVQKHSMEFYNIERNPQIANAYLLLGKSRYYSQRFVPALEAFNFIFKNYLNDDLRNRTRVWQSKTLIRLENEKRAIEGLKILLKDENLDLDIVEEAHTTLAMAYTALDSTTLVIRHLDSAILFSEDVNRKARNLFILGQLYRKEQKIDSSNYAFEKLFTNRKTPYKYKLQAHIDRFKNYSEQDSLALVFEDLEDLIDERENRPYLDELYYQRGVIELKNDSVSKAVADFEKSLHTKQVKEFQKELSYEQLGDIYFDKAKFLTAGAYYDSIVQITKNKNVKRIRRIIRKQKSLEEVVLYEQIAKLNDSVLSIAALPKEAQEKFYNTYIEKLKKEEEEAKRKLENATVTSGFGNLNDDSSKSSQKGRKFYFYNVQVAGFGKQEFRKVWGNRPLEDDWRVSTKKVIAKSGVKSELEELATANTFDTSKKYELDYYLSRIPTEKEQIDSIASLRNDAYFKLGLIYKEQFKEYPLAAERLEKLLTFPPKESMILPAKYHLYKIYSHFNIAQSNKYREDIVNTYPDSRYAIIILNPEKVLALDEDENSPEAVYNNAYCDYDYERYDAALEKAKQAIQRFEDMPIVPKFELLKAYIFKKTKGVKAFTDALDFVSISYPNTEEGKHAVKILSSISNAESDSKKDSIKK